MLDIKFIRENPNIVKDGLRRKGADVDIDALLALDAEHRQILKQLEDLRAVLNQLSKDIAEGDDDKKKDAEDIKVRLKNLEPTQRDLSQKLGQTLLQLPNLPLVSMLEGKDECDNKVVREGGEKIDFSFKPKNYLTLAEDLDLIDMERGAKVAGTRFGILKNEVALLEFALIRYGQDLLLSEGFTPVIALSMIKPEMFRGMGRLAADQEEDRYYLQKDDLYLAGSAEHTIGPMHSGEILKESELPKRYLGFSTCFRREAGSYGKDTKGILRVHQFDKLEMFVFAKPEDSEEELERLVAWQERLVQGLGFSYRVVEICTGDMGWTDAHQFDIETWLPGQNGGKGEYRETHSASNTTDFQARGINVRYKNKAGKTDYVHMLNATAIAIGRMLIAIIENYQQNDGSIVVPDILRPYVNFERIS
ncbi:MAG: serine--tRNA ligase [Candidatus Terrybacteria bacterium RIFCSPHIGHO2_01_FULL_48_17]|uniref:Serine--tRNA ligase n=1 Tax=Candidatus Terrybacteria bacterium RIFCSPHIGHO2_01_FULL_48_17 TaxID=1802362 RepID=A0A1G2PJ18_9BACT|nr:MAG: serine--tRNA ligase [Candidatus Terrybacteria bacterium RIFCSPHIGHO2_01_FULL_48_17]OHA53134.1 MAG: serine--tRNA ligase [Candidatus Terrybacteria bacterium RIFCSPLOWO2_01_FULL_48_14]